VSTLSVTLIDVGWGDSILIESQNNQGKCFYALIDSNDTTYFRSSFIFLKRFFERKQIKPKGNKHLFEFILLSHAHADHGQGLQGIFTAYGTKRFWYPKSLTEDDGVNVNLAKLIRYSNRYKQKVKHHQAVDNTKDLKKVKFGDVEMKILWPDYNKIDLKNENNNSVVLLLKLNNVSFVLTGDAEAEVWHQISDKIPKDTRFFKVPHHGSVNGAFDAHNKACWLDDCPDTALFGISSHITPHELPDPEVIQLLSKHDCFRTDEHYHTTFRTNGSDVEVKYSHV
jgi:competence protein ComEC